MLTRRLTSEVQYVLACFSDIYEDAASKSLRAPREKQFEPQKVVRAPGVLTVLTSNLLKSGTMGEPSLNLPSTASK